MTDSELLILSKAHGFHAVTVEPASIPIDPAFRTYCEENACGNYGANYSCPPDCGTPEELRRHILTHKRIIVIQTVWNLDGFDDGKAAEHARLSHNEFLIRLTDRMRAEGTKCSALGCGGCTLCRSCRRKLSTPCIFPEKRMGCMSAYCIDVSKLSEQCGLEFAWSNDRLYLFGMILIS